MEIIQIVTIIQGLRMGYLNDRPFQNSNQSCTGPPYDIGEFILIDCTYALLSTLDNAYSRQRMEQGAVKVWIWPVNITATVRRLCRLNLRVHRYPDNRTSGCRPTFRSIVGATRCMVNA